MSTTVTITLEHYVSLALRHHPYILVQKDDEIWTAIMSVPSEERLSYVLENEEWTIGFNCQPIQSVQGIKDGYRLWYRKDWELCDNKRQEACRRIDAAQAEWKANQTLMLATVKDNFMALPGSTEMVWNMFSSSLSDVVLKDMYGAIQASKKQ